MHASTLVCWLLWGIVLGIAIRTGTATTKYSEGDTTPSLRWSCNNTEDKKIDVKQKRMCLSDEPTTLHMICLAQLGLSYEKQIIIVGLGYICGLEVFKKGRK